MSERCEFVSSLENQLEQRDDQIVKLKELLREAEYVFEEAYSRSAERIKISEAEIGFLKTEIGRLTKVDEDVIAKMETQEYRIDELVETVESQSEQIRRLAEREKERESFNVLSQIYQEIDLAFRRELSGSISPGKDVLHLNDRSFLSDTVDKRTLDIWHKYIPMGVDIEQLLQDLLTINIKRNSFAHPNIAQLSERELDSYLSSIGEYLDSKKAKDDLLVFLRHNRQQWSRQIESPFGDSQRGRGRMVQSSIETMRGRARYRGGTLWDNV